MLTSSLPGLLQNQSLETIIICTVVLCFPHNNNACIHMCDECIRSNVLNVCRKLLSILWSILQLCSLTIEYQVFQYVPTFSISEQFVSKPRTTLVAPGRNPWFEQTSGIIHNILADLTFSLSATQINMVKEWCWFSQINVFHENCSKSD